MKRILITGVNSYVGNSLEKWLLKDPEKYLVEKISLRDGTWKKQDFSSFDVVVHVAGIAHVSRNPKMEDLYYKVNRDLTIEVAKKAKLDGVNQFIFLSSIIVYGENIENDGVINKHTQPNPSNFYGKSKLQAEEGILPLQNERFNIVIIRPPMIYGKGSKGNFPKLVKLAKVIPVFPNIDNKRSMIYIDNLCEFIRLMICNKEKGLFFPQNKEYVKTSEMVRLIAEVSSNKVRLFKGFNPILRLFIGKIRTIDKVFGNLYYDNTISTYKDDYHVRRLRDSIMHIEKQNVDESSIDILLMSDNGLETVGGEQESTKIIMKGINDFLKIGVIQPGFIKWKLSGIKYYNLTSKTRIKHLIKNPISFIKYILKVRRIIITEKPKIIHTQAQVSFFIVGLLKKCNLISNNIKFIHTERGLYTKYSVFFKKLFMFFMKEVDTLVTTTNFNLKFWENALNQKEISMDYRVIENTAGQLFETFDEKYKKKDSDILSIGFAGRFTDWKNWPLAVEITEKLESVLKDKLYVKMAVGCLDKKAENDTKVMFDKMKRLLGDRFSGEININLKEMNRFYYDTDIFILTSNYNTESFGRTLVEAMSRKNVVLTTNAGGSVEVVGNNTNVLDSSEAFVDRILYFYNDKNLMNDEKENNFVRVKGKYSLNNNINKHKDLYTKTIRL